VQERQHHQWDVASFIAATAALTLSTYNTVQISKLETAIEKQQQKTDLLTDIVHIHEQHLHQLDEMIEDIGNEIQKLKVQAGFYFSVDRAIAQVISDSNKLRAVVTIFEWVINSAFDQKLAPGALSIDVLDKIVNHIKDTAAQIQFHNFIHQPSDLYKL
jgi:predicted small metal-binding protein